MTLLIDADWLIYSSCCSCEHDYRWDEWHHSLHLDEKEVHELIQYRVEQYQGIAEDSGQVIMCFSEYPTFRHTLSQDYKTNRIGKRKPLGLKRVIEQVADYYHSVSFPNLEGDDVMSLLATGGRYDNPIIVSVDKDMRGVPCTLLAKDDLELVTRKKADRNWMLQVLQGDATDNIQGLTGVGPKTAEKLLGDLESPKDMWNKVVEEYKKKGRTYADAVMTAQLTRILRDGEYDHVTGEVKLWEPIYE